MGLISRSLKSNLQTSMGDEPHGFQPRAKKPSRSPMEPNEFWKKDLVGFNTIEQMKTIGEFHRDILDATNRKDGTYAINYGKNMAQTQYSEKLLGKHTKCMNGELHPRMRSGRNLTMNGAYSAPCPIRLKRFLFCSLNLSDRAALAQCRQEFRDWKDCSKEQTGARDRKMNTRLMLEQQLKEVSRGLGDYYLDLTSDHYFHWADPAGSSGCTVGDDGKQLDGLQGHQYKFVGRIWTE